MAAVTSIMRAQQIVQMRVDEVLRPYDLTFARYEVLMLLHFSSRGSMPVKKAASGCRCTRRPSPTAWTGSRARVWCAASPTPATGAPPSSR